MVAGQILDQVLLVAAHISVHVRRLQQVICPAQTLRVFHYVFRLFLYMVLTIMIIDDVRKLASLYKSRKDGTVKGQLKKDPRRSMTVGYNVH